MDLTGLEIVAILGGTDNLLAISKFKNNHAVIKEPGVPEKDSKLLRVFSRSLAHRRCLRSRRWYGSMGRSRGVEGREWQY